MKMIERRMQERSSDGVLRGEIRLIADLDLVPDNAELPHALSRRMQPDDLQWESRRLFYAGYRAQGEYAFFGYLHEDDSVTVLAGCREFSLEQAREHWNDATSRREVASRELIDRIERMAHECKERIQALTQRPAATSTVEVKPHTIIRLSGERITGAGCLQLLRDLISATEAGTTEIVIEHPAPVISISADSNGISRAAVEATEAIAAVADAADPMRITADEVRQVREQLGIGLMEAQDVVKRRKALQVLQRFEREAPHDEPARDLCAILHYLIVGR